MKSPVHAKSGSDLGKCEIRNIRVSHATPNRPLQRTVIHKARGIVSGAAATLVPKSAYRYDEQETMCSEAAVLKSMKMHTLTAEGTLIGFAGFICSFHCALCSAIFCVAQAADSPIASVTLAVPEAAMSCEYRIPYRPHRKSCVSPTCCGSRMPHKPNQEEMCCWT